MSTYRQGGITYQMKPFEVDRRPFLEELANNPRLAAATRSMIKSEAGGMDPAAQQQVFGTMLNRSAGLGTTLEDTVLRTGKRYYEPYRNGAFARNYGPANSGDKKDFYDRLMTAELQTPTTARSHNASAGVAASAKSGGWDAIPYRLGGGQMADKEYLYDKDFAHEKNFQRMARTVVPTPGANPERGPRETPAPGAFTEPEKEAQSVAIEDDKVAPVTAAVQGINEQVVRDAEGRIVGFKAPGSAGIPEVYDRVRDERLAAAQSLYAPKDMNWATRIGGAMQAVGVPIDIAQNGSKAVYARAMMGNTLLDKHAAEQAKMAGALRKTSMGIHDASITGKGTHEIEQYKLDVQRKQAARTKVGDYLQLNGYSEATVANAARTLEAAGDLEAAKNLREGWKMQSGQQVQAAEDKHFETDPGDAPIPGVESPGSTIAPDIVPETAITPRADIPQLPSDPSQAVQLPAGARQPAIDPGAPAMPRDEMPKEVSAAEARIAQLKANAPLLSADAQKQAKDEIKHLNETYVKPYRERFAKNTADEQFKAAERARLLKTEGPAARQALEYREGQVNTTLKLLEGLIDPETGKPTENLRKISGSAWKANQTLDVLRSGTPEYKAIASIDRLKRIFSLEGLEALRAAGVAPGPMTEKEWVLMESRLANLDRNMRPEDLAAEVLEAHKLLRRTIESQRKTYTNKFGVPYRLSTDSKPQAAAGGDKKPDAPAATNKPPVLGDERPHPETGVPMVRTESGWVPKTEKKKKPRPTVAPYDMLQGRYGQ